MIVHVIAQPRVGAPVQPVAVPTAPSESAPPAPSGELTQPLCESANHAMWITDAGYDVAAALAAVVLFVALKRRVFGTRPVRMLGAIALAAIGAGVLTAMDPLRADDVARCMHSSDYARFILYAGAAAPRILVLGVAPAALLALVACAIVDRVY